MGSKYAPHSPDLSGYAPQSPDLTSYRPQSPSFEATGNNYAPQSPDLSGVQSYQGAGQQVLQYNLDQHQPLQHQQLQHLSQQHQSPSQWSQQLTSYPQQQQQQQQQLYPVLPQQIHPLHQQYQQDPYATYPLQQQHPSPTYPPQHYTSFPDTMPAQTRTSNRTQPRSYAEPADNEFDYAPPAAEYMPLPTIKPEDSDFNQQQEQEVPPAPTPARRGRKPKSETQGNGSSMAQPALQKMDTGGVEVKTKFPTARIKRIMQADEDVGKVAQVTPVVVAKALELFMIRLITSSANVAKSRGSKKVMSQHMKAAVMQDDQFDNLRDIMAKVPDAQTSKNGAKDEDDDEEGAAPKPKGRGKGKKRRDSDDF